MGGHLKGEASEGTGTPCLACGCALPLSLAAAGEEVYWVLALAGDILLIPEKPQFLNLKRVLRILFIYLFIFLAVVDLLGC